MGVGVLPINNIIQNQYIETLNANQNVHLGSLNTVNNIYDTEKPLNSHINNFTTQQKPVQMPNPVKPIDFNKSQDINSSIPNFTNLNTQ